jgi:hypothetical protein
MKEGTQLSQYNTINTKKPIYKYKRTPKEYRLSAKENVVDFLIKYAYGFAFGIPVLLIVLSKF